MPAQIPHADLVVRRRAVLDALAQACADEGAPVSAQLVERGVRAFGLDLSVAAVRTTLSQFHAGGYVAKIYRMGRPTGSGASGHGVVYALRQYPPDSVIEAPKRRANIRQAA